MGDEGWFQEANPPTYPYAPGVGINFVTNLQIDTLDFGTFHSYPEASPIYLRAPSRTDLHILMQSWGQTANESAWGVQWIADHATAQKNANKPVILGKYSSIASHMHHLLDG